MASFGGCFFVRTISGIVLGACIFIGSGCSAFRGGFVDGRSAIVQESVAIDNHLARIEKNYSPKNCSDIESILNDSSGEDDPLFHFHDGLRDHLQKIYVVEDEDFFYNLKHLSASQAAHAHTDSGIVCISYSSIVSHLYVYHTLLHEGAHIKHYYLNAQNSDFSREWMSVAGIDYGSMARLKDDGGVEWTDGSSLSNHGCLDAYSATSLAEDIATFTASVASLEYRSSEDVMCYIEIANNGSVGSACRWSVERIARERECIEKIKKLGHDSTTSLARIFSLYFCDSSDERYKKKIDLLRKYNFISEEQHFLMTANLGSLRFLLSKDAGKGAWKAP